MSADVPPPLWCPSAPEGRRERELKNQKIGGVVSFVHRTATISVFLSDAKCSPICRAQTCAHSGVEPSRSAKVFLQGGPKSSKKFRIFHHFETLRPYISETVNNRGIWAAHGKKLYLSPIQLSYVFGPIAHGVLQGEPKSEWRNTSFAPYAYGNSAVCRFCFS